jgi:hypothetical protein
VSVCMFVCMCVYIFVYVRVRVSVSINLNTRRSRLDLGHSAKKKSTSPLFARYIKILSKTLQSALIPTVAKIWRTSRVIFHTVYNLPTE